MGKRSVKVNTFFPKRIFSPDIWGAQTRNENVEEYDEFKIVSKFAAKTIPSSNSFSTRGQKYASNEENEFHFVGNYSDETVYSSGFTQSAEPATGFSISPSSFGAAEAQSVIPYLQSTEAQLANAQLIAYEQAELENESELRAKREIDPDAYHVPAFENHSEPTEYQEAISYGAPAGYKPSPHDIKPVYEDPIVYEETAVIEEPAVMYLEPLVYDEPEIIEEAVHYHEPIIDELPRAFAPSPHDLLPVTEEQAPYQEPTSNYIHSAYSPSVELPEANIAPSPFLEPTIEQSPMAYQEPIAQPIVAPEPEPVPVAPREMSEYERLVSANTKDFAPETHVIEEEKSDFDYFALKGTEEVDPHNNSLQFANSEFVNKQIEEIESKELEDSKGIGELLATYKKKIIIGVAAVVFVICAAILYISFTSSSDTPSIPVPTDQSSGTSGEKPVILVPSQNGGTQQSGYDQNGNVVGQ